MARLLAALLNAIVDVVTAEYTPGPRGGAFDPRLASSLPSLFGAQVARLEVI